MREVRRSIWYMAVFYILLGYLLAVAPKTVEAANEDFVISKGVLKDYNGDDQNVIVPGNVKKIDAGAFYGCKKIKKVTIPKSVKKIGERAFYGCVKLEAITIPKSIKEIGKDAFYKTAWLKKKQKSRKDHLVIINGILVDGTKASGNISIPKSVTVVADGAFLVPDHYGENKKVKSIKIPSSVTKIGNFAFAGCVKIKEITFPKSVKSIGRGAVNSCGSLKDVTILNPKAKLCLDYDKKTGTMFENIFEGTMSGIQGKKITIHGYKNSTAEKLANYLREDWLWDAGYRTHEKVVFRPIKK